MITHPDEKLYICPGETHPISRAVHLSRLSAYFPACRDCPFRNDTGNLPRQTIERLQETERRVERKSLFTAEGVRGTYLNELTRSKGEKFAAALAALVWEHAPFVARAEEMPRKGRRSGPTIVAGHDERPSSPDIVMGVAAALRRMGCTVVDVSRCTEPCFRFAVDHLQASAGIYVTGAGHGPAWTGFNFVGARGAPLASKQCRRETTSARSSEHPVLSLDTLEQLLQRPVSRPTRQAGTQRTFLASVPYEAGVLKHFHALRPLRVACGSSSRLVREIVARLFAPLPCTLLIAPIPRRERNLLDPRDADVKRMTELLRQERADLGVLIDDDGSRMALIDELGHFVPPAILTGLIAEMTATEQPGAAVVVETSALEAVQRRLGTLGKCCVDGGRTAAEMAAAMQRHQAPFGGGDSGRYWFREGYPACDAILTLARVLDLLSRGDVPVSECVAAALSAPGTDVRV